jgi:RNA polymerase sigma-70 factor (ECF subfamily)
LNASEFPAIYAAYFPKVVGYLRKLVGDADAEDVAQETFAKISRSLDGFRGESQLSTWIFRIATNAALDLHRRPSSRTAYQGDIYEHKYR